MQLQLQLHKYNILYIILLTLIILSIDVEFNCDNNCYHVLCISYMTKKNITFYILT